jgi:hypothetical protein
VALPSHVTQAHATARTMTGKSALACTMSPKWPCAAAQTALVAPHNGHHRPVNA